MKKAKKTTTAKDRKPAKTDKPFVDLLNAAMNEMKDRFLINKGKHDARASLLAPTLVGLQAVAATGGHVGPPRNAVLNPTDCALLLECLAEAGYVPAPTVTTEEAQRQRIVRMPMPAPSPLDGCTDKVPPVAKAA